MRDYTVVVNDCAAPAVPGLTHVRTRDTAHGKANFTYSYDGIVEGFATTLDAREQDWLDVLGAIFAADLNCPRGPEAEWNRRIALHIPVRLPDVWTPLAPALSDLFGELTYDDLALTFHADPSPAPPPRQRKTPFASYDSVALFSGGTDSFVGTAELLALGKTPALVTHAPGSAIRTAGNYLRGELRKHGSLGPSLTLTAQRRKDSGNAENSQRSRSLLFLGTAALVAARAGLDTVYINENGVMAVHAPMTAARIGSLSTRTASPSLLDQFGDVASAALNQPITALNLLQQDTKPDVVGRGKALGVGHALANTISCWAIGRSGRHCGYCAPCLIRRISFETHNVLDIPYECDAFDGDRAEDATARDNLVQLLMLAKDLAELAPADIELDYTELLNTGSTMTLGESIAMHQRWGAQALAVAANHAYTAALLR